MGGGGSEVVHVALRWSLWPGWTLVLGVLGGCWPGCTQIMGGCGLSWARGVVGTCGHG